MLFFKFLPNRTKCKSKKNYVITDFSRSPQTIDPIKEKTLDFSNVETIQLPKLEQPDFNKYRLPPEFWEKYHEGVALYKDKDYHEAKNIFIKLLKFENPHKLLFEKLSLTYRRLIVSFMKIKEFENAYDEFINFHQKCKDYITETDKKRFDKLMVKLLNKNPNTVYKKLEFKEKKIEPDFRVKYARNDYKIILLQKQKNSESNDTRKNGFYDSFGDDTTYLNSLFNYENKNYDKSIVIIRDSRGSIANEFLLNHKIIGFKSSEKSNKFILCSDEFKLYLYSKVKGNLQSYDLNKYIKNKSDIRFVDISPDGEFILFSLIDKFYLMKSDFEIIAIWNTPLMEGWTKSEKSDNTDTKKYFKELSLLDLKGHPTKIEIKKAFRKKLFEFHPDRNPDDFDANKRTIEIIKAYEMLTNEEAQNAFDKIEDKEYYYKVEKTIKGFSAKFNTFFKMEIRQCGSGVELISSISLRNNAMKIYLGCYSGKVYCISNNGIANKCYNCHHTPSSIHERKEYLYIEAGHNLFIVKNDKCIANVKTYRKGRIKWNKKGFIFFSSNVVRLYSDNGILIVRINFKDRLFDAFLDVDNLIVMTLENNFIFHLSN